MKMLRRFLYLALLPLITVSADANDRRHDPFPSWRPASVVRVVRAATARFRDESVAVAEGYVADPFCVSGPNGGAMGVHYLNFDLLDDNAVDPEHPEALIYEPLPGGRLQLVGVEYIADVEAWHAANGPATLPVVDGHLFHHNGAPNRYAVPAFYELHVWAWKHNPDGTFTDWNPDVSCDAYEPAP
jgi:hypothetical protein